MADSILYNTVQLMEDGVRLTTVGEAPLGSIVRHATGYYVVGAPEGRDKVGVSLSSNGWISKSAVVSQLAAGVILQITIDG